MAYEWMRRFAKHAGQRGERGLPLWSARGGTHWEIDGAGFVSRELLTKVGEGVEGLGVVDALTWIAFTKLYRKEEVGVLRKNHGLKTRVAT